MNEPLLDLLENRGVVPIATPDSIPSIMFHDMRHGSPEQAKGGFLVTGVDSLRKPMGYETGRC